MWCFVMCMCCYVVTNVVYCCVMYCCVMYNYVLYCYVLYCYCITLHPQLGSFASQLPLIIYKTHTMWGPKTIAKLVNTTPITMAYDTQIAIINGVYKPTYKYGADCICTNIIYIHVCMYVYPHYKLHWSPRLRALSATATSASASAVACWTAWRSVLEICDLQKMGSSMGGNEHWMGYPWGFLETWYQLNHFVL